MTCKGAWVTPGLIDCHTHTVFGGNRSGEFEQRLRRPSATPTSPPRAAVLPARRTRASEDELFESAHKRLRSLLRDGVRPRWRSVDCDAWTLASERKLLRVIRRLGDALPVSVRATCLAAHALPPEYKDRADAYIDHICSEMLPALAAEGLLDAVDAFCEYLAFSPEQVERVFKSRPATRPAVKLHAEQLSSLHGSSLAARYHALSADHLEFMTEEDAIAMAAAGTVAVLLPGAFYFLRETQLPPMDALRKHGVKIAIASDLNPGTSPALSVRLMLNIACTLFRMTPEEPWPAPPNMPPPPWAWAPPMGRWKWARSPTLSPGRSIVPPTWPTGWAASWINASCAMASMSLFKESRCG